MKKKSFEFNSILLFVLMMAANVCNYLFQIIVSKLIGSVELYGIVNTLISIQSIVLVPNTLMVMVAARYTALYSLTGEKEKYSETIALLQKYVLGWASILVAGGAVASPVISAILKLNNSIYVWGVFAVAAVTVLSAVFVGILQGKQEFWAYGIQNLLNMLCKLVFSILFVWIGWSVFGVLGALLLGALAIWIYSYMHVKKYYVKNEEKAKIDQREIKQYIFGTMCFQVCITFMTNGDMLLVKAFFDETQAGIYASAMVIGKIALYVSGAVVGTLFPMVATAKAEGKETKSLLKKAFLYGGGMVIICALVMIFGGKLIVGILFGTSYEQAVAYLPAICAFVVPLAFLTIVSNFIIALGETKIVSYCLVSGSVVMLLIAMFFHGSVAEMLCAIGIVLLVTFGIEYHYSKKHMKKME